MVAELVATREWNWVTFETKPMKHFAEVALEGEDLLEINVAYGFSEHFQTLFGRQKVSIPAGWQVREFREESWLRGGSMLLTTGVRDVDRIGKFIDQLFPAIYGEPQGYILRGHYQK